MRKKYGPGEIKLRQAISRRRAEQQPHPAVSTVDLFNILCDHFSEEELKTFCFFTLSLDYEALPGDGKRSEAREIIAHYLRADTLDKLAHAIREQRPDLAI